MDYQEIKVQDVDSIQTKQQLFNLPDNKTPQIPTYLQSPLTLENEDEVKSARRNVGNQLFIIDSSNDGRSNSKEDSAQPKLSLLMPSREAAAEINMMTMTDPESIREVQHQLAAENYMMPMPLRDQVFVQPKQLKAIQPNVYDFQSKLKGHKQSPQRALNNQISRLDSVFSQQQNMSQNIFPQGLRRSIPKDIGNLVLSNRNSHRENYSKSPKRKQANSKENIVQTGAHGGDYTKNTVILDQNSNNLELRLDHFNMPTELSNKDIMHSLRTPHSPKAKEEETYSSNQKLANQDGIESHKSSIALLPEYQLTGRFKQYAVIADQSGIDNKMRLDSMAAQTYQGSYLPIETESGDHIRDDSKPLLQQPKKPVAHLQTKSKPFNPNSQRRDHFSTSFLVEHRQARKNQPLVYRKSKKSVAEISSTSKPSQKSSLNRTQREIDPQQFRYEDEGAIRKNTSIEKIMTYKAEDDSEQVSHATKLAPAAQRELAQLYRMSNIQKYIAETQVPSQIILTTSQGQQNEDGAHTFMQADASIAALDTSGFMNYGNIPYNDASKDFIMISDKDEQSRDSPIATSGLKSKRGHDGQGFAQIFNLRATKGAENRSSTKQFSHKGLVPPSGGGNFQQKPSNPAINISIDIKKTQTQLNNDLSSSKQQFKFSEFTDPVHGLYPQPTPRRSPIVSKINLGAVASLDLDIAGFSIQKRHTNVAVQKDRFKTTRQKQGVTDQSLLQVRGQNRQNDGSFERDHRLPNKNGDSPRISLHQSLSNLSEMRSLEKKIEQWSSTEGKGPFSYRNSSSSPMAKDKKENRNQEPPLSPIQTHHLQTDNSQLLHTDQSRPPNASGKVLIHYNQLLEQRQRDQQDALNVYKKSFKNLYSANTDKSLPQARDKMHKRSPKALKKRQIVDMVPSLQVIEEKKRLEHKNYLMNQATSPRRGLFNYNQSNSSRGSLEASESALKEQGQRKEQRAKDYSSPQVISINMGEYNETSNILSRDPSQDQMSTPERSILKSPKNNTIKIVPKNFNLSPAPKQKGQNIRIQLQNKRYDTQKLEELGDSGQRLGDRTSALPEDMQETGSSFQHPFEALDGMNMLAQQITLQSEQTKLEETRLAEILEGKPETLSHISPDTPERDYLPSARIEEDNGNQKEQKGAQTNIKMMFVNDGSLSVGKESLQSSKKGPQPGGNNRAQQNKHLPEITMEQIKQSDQGPSDYNGVYSNQKQNEETFSSFAKKPKNQLQIGEKRFADKHRSPPFKVSQIQLQYGDNDSSDKEGNPVEMDNSQTFSQLTPGVNQGLRNHGMTAKFQTQLTATPQKKNAQLQQKQLETLKQLARDKEQNRSKPVTDRVAKLQKKKQQLEQGILTGYKPETRADFFNQSQDIQEFENFFTKQASINYIPSLDEQVSRSRLINEVFKSQLQLPKISQLSNFSKNEDVRRSNDRIFRSQLRGKAGGRNAHNRHRTSSVLPKIESIASISGNLGAFGEGSSSPSLHNALSRRYITGNVSSNQILPVVNRKQRNQYDRFKFYKSKDLAPTDMAARKGQQAREENYAARGGAVSNKKYHGRAKVIDSKRDSQGAVLVENLEPKYEGSVPAVARNSRMTLEVPVKDSIEQHMKTSNRQTLLSSEKRDVFGVPQYHSGKSGLKKLPITAQDLDMSNINDRHRLTFDENAQPKGEADLMFQFLSETSQKETLKVRGGEDSIILTNSSPAKLSQKQLQSVVESINGINYNPKITSNQELIHKKVQNSPSSNNSPIYARSPMLSQKYGSPSNKDLKIAVTFQQKSIELGTQTADHNRNLIRETSGKQLTDSHVSQTGPSPSLHHQHSGPFLPILQSEKSQKQFQQGKSTKRLKQNTVVELKIMKEQVSIETDEMKHEMAFRPSSTMIIHNLAQQSREMMSPNSKVRLISPQTVLQQANKEKFSQIQKLKQLQSKFQISESVLKYSKSKRRQDTEMQTNGKNTNTDQKHVGISPGESDLNELRSWHSQRDQVESMHKNEGAYYFQDTRGLNFKDEHLLVQSPYNMRKVRSKNASPVIKASGVMREYGYDKMNSIFMNEKVVDQEPNYGNTVSKGNQMSPRNTLPINEQPSGPYNMLTQGQDTEHGSMSPSNEPKNQSRTLYGGKYNQTSRIDLTDDEMTELEKLRHRPDFVNKGLTQSNFADTSGGVYLPGHQILNSNREGSQNTYIASASKPGSVVDQTQRNQIIVMQQNNESNRTPIQDTKITQQSDIAVVLSD